MSQRSPSPSPSLPAPQSLSAAYGAAQERLKLISQWPTASAASSASSASLAALCADALSTLSSLQSLVASSGALSGTDSISELQPSSLRLLLLSPDVARCLLAWPGMEGRRQRVERAIASYLSFLSLCDHLDALLPAEAKRLRAVRAEVAGGDEEAANGGSGSETRRQQPDAGKQRQEKIARFKQQRELEKQIAACEWSRSERRRQRAVSRGRRGDGGELQSAATAVALDGKEDEDEDEDEDEEEASRSYWLQRLHLAVLTALDDVLLCHQELQMLREREQRQQTAAATGEDGDDQQQAAPQPAAHRPLVYSITDAAQLSAGIPADMQAFLHPLPAPPPRPASASSSSSSPLLTTLAGALAARPDRASVFRQPNPASVSVEDWAEREMAEGRMQAPHSESRQRRSREQRGFIGRTQPVPAEDDDEDAVGERGGEADERAADDKAREQRGWDDWKDEHEKGAGNRTGRR